MKFFVKWERKFKDLREWDATTVSNLSIFCSQHLVIKTYVWLHRFLVPLPTCPLFFGWWVPSTKGEHRRLLGTADTRDGNSSSQMQPKISKLLMTMHALTWGELLFLVSIDTQIAFRVTGPNWWKSIIFLWGNRIYTHASFGEIFVVAFTLPWDLVSKERDWIEILVKCGKHCVILMVRWFAVSTFYRFRHWCGICGFCIP